MNTLDWIKKIASVEIGKCELLYIRDFALVWNLFERELGNPTNYAILTSHIYEFEKREGLKLIDCTPLIEYFRDRYISGPNAATNSDNLKLSNKETVLGQLEKSNPHVISESLLPIILRVRNNLFHGNKLIHHIEYQEELFERIIEFLRSLIDAIIDYKQGGRYRY